MWFDSPSFWRRFSLRVEKLERHQGGLCPLDAFGWEYFITGKSAYAALAGKGLQ